ncbi:MAG: hypothetical protein NTV54_01015 [Ignavibacteriales bacterium]|nr:hypothetical protein [Ignavibacteriales bacterium]
MAGRSLSITSYFLGRRMGSSDLASHGEVRLMRRDAANAVLSGKKAFLPSAESPPAFESPLEHHGAASLQSLLSAMNDSTSLDVTEGDAQTHGGRSFVTRPLGTFTHLFFGQMGYRDGMHGLFYALFQAMRVLLISAKRWELERACRSGGATPPVTVEMVMNLKRLE